MLYLLSTTIEIIDGKGIGLPDVTIINVTFYRSSKVHIRSTRYDWNDSSHEYNMKKKFNYADEPKEKLINIHNLVRKRTSIITTRYDLSDKVWL